MLRKDVKEKYTLEEYKTYIENNIYQISTEADKCLLEKNDTSRIYTIIDKNKNKYVFSEKSIMNYNVSFYLNEENE